MSNNNYILTADGKLHTVSDEELYHWSWGKKGEERENHKYTKREWKNGRWQYTYPEDKKSEKSKKARTKETKKNNNFFDRAKNAIGKAVSSIGKSVDEASDKIENLAKSAVEKLGETKLGEVLNKAGFNVGKSAVDKALEEATGNLDRAKKRESYTDKVRAKSEKKLADAQKVADEANGVLDEAKTAYENFMNAKSTVEIPALADMTDDPELKLFLRMTDEHMRKNAATNKDVLRLMDNSIRDYNERIAEYERMTRSFSTTEREEYEIMVRHREALLAAREPLQTEKARLTDELTNAYYAVGQAQRNVDDMLTEVNINRTNSITAGNIRRDAEYEKARAQSNKYYENGRKKNR